jgi:hypothetical protein
VLVNKISPPFWRHFHRIPESAGAAGVQKCAKQVQNGHKKRTARKFRTVEIKKAQDHHSCALWGRQKAAPLIPKDEASHGLSSCLL